MAAKILKIVAIVVAVAAAVAGIYLLVTKILNKKKGELAEEEPIVDPSEIAADAEAEADEFKTETVA